MRDNNVVIASCEKHVIPARFRRESAGFRFPTLSEKNVKFFPKSAPRISASVKTFGNDTMEMTDEGFSLLEIIVSLVILSTLAAGIFATVSFAKRVSIQAQQKAIAVSLIESKLSELKSMGAADLDPNGNESVNDLSAVTDEIVRNTTPGPCQTLVKTPPYCVNINEFNSRMTGLVMANVADDLDPNSSGSKIVLVVAKWIDFTVPGGRIRTESAVTVM